MFKVRPLIRNLFLGKTSSSDILFVHPKCDRVHSAENLSYSDGRLRHLWCHVDLWWNLLDRSRCDVLFFARNKRQESRYKGR